MIESRTAIRFLSAGVHVIARRVFSVVLISYFWEETDQFAMTIARPTVGTTSFLKVFKRFAFVSNRLTVAFAIEISHEILMSTRMTASDGVLFVFVRARFNQTKSNQIESN